MSEDVGQSYRYGITQIWSERREYEAFTTGAAISSILIIKLDHIGDLVLAFEGLFRLRSIFPDASMTIACGPWNVWLASSLGIFDRVVPVSFFAAHAEDGVLDFKPETLNDLACLSFDLAIDLRVDPDTRVVLDYVNAAYKCGFESPECKSPLTLTLRPADISAGLGSHRSLEMLRLVDAVGNFFKPDGEVNQVIRARLTRGPATQWFANLPRPVVTIGTGSGRRLKNWPIANFRRLVQWLSQELEVGVILLGGKDAEADAGLIEADVTSDRLRSCVGQTSLSEALSVIANADIHIGNDTSLTHFAAQFGVRTIGLYSGVDRVDVWASRGPHVEIIRNPTACSPCHKLRFEECSYGNACMTGIDLEVVKGVVRRNLLDIVGHLHGRI